MSEDKYSFNKSSVTVNGRRLSYSGGSIYMVNGKVIVDGQAVDTGNAPVVNIVVEGNAGDISGEFADITVHGDAKSVKNMSGSVSIYGNVAKNAESMSGAVIIGGSIGGNAKTMSGNITSNPSPF